MGAGTGVISNAGQNVTGSNSPYANTSSPYIQAAQQTALGNLAGAQAATAANRVNQSTPYANLNYNQTGVDANGNPIYAANQTLNNGLQSGLQNISSNVINATASPFGVANTQNQIANNAALGQQGWNTATQDVMSSLQPQLNQQNEQLTNSLAQQGIQPGTQAYNNAMQLQGINQNNLLAQAALTGATVQNQQVGQNIAQQGANNSALQNNYTQNLAAYNNPLQQLNAFQSGTNPGYINPAQQAAVSGPDYNSANTTAQNAQIAANNAALGQQTNLQSGLFGLGSSAILGAGGVGNLLSGIGGGLSGLSSLFSTPASAAFTNPTSAGTFAGDAFSL